MIREEKKNQEVVVKQRYCDCCFVKVDRSLGCNVARCEMCKKELCDKCVGHENETYGDYREVYCENCWKCGEEYRNQIKSLNVKIDNLMDSWLKVCNYDAIEIQAIDFTKYLLRVADGLLSDDYKTGFKEGVENYIRHKRGTYDNEMRGLLVDFAQFIQGQKNKGLDYDCVELEVDAYLKKINKESNK